MSKLCYEPRTESKLIQQSEIYPVFSSYQDKELKERFQQLKAKCLRSESCAGGKVYYRHRTGFYPANEPGKGLYPGKIPAGFHGRGKEIASNV